MSADALVRSWIERGRARWDGALTFTTANRSNLARKARRAYQWIARNAIFTALGDIEPGPVVRSVRGQEVEIGLTDGVSYASFLLLPLLTLFTGRRLVFVGAPGRGKTSVATLMALLCGTPLAEVRRSIQHGHPQLTVHDLLGSALPSRLMEARSAGEVPMEWRQWIRQRVKIIDEYNRIPTKTQSALLSLVADGYAEQYEQVVHTGPSAWFFTANDDQGGGTFPVIEALRDRIDVVVRCTPFHTQFLHVLAERVSSAVSAESLIPDEIVFDQEDLAMIDAEIRAVPVPSGVLDRLGFFVGQLEFCRRASPKIEHMNKDTLHLAGRRVGHVCTEDCPLDKLTHLCSQTENGCSPRALQGVLHYAQALAWFLGSADVSDHHIRQILPWAFHDKLRPNPQSGFFQRMEHKVFLLDRAAWILRMFDDATQQYAAYASVRASVDALARLEAAADGAELADLRRAQAAVQVQMDSLLATHELCGPVHEDLVRLKHLYGRYQERIERRLHRD